MPQALDDLKQVKFKLTATVNVIISSMRSSLFCFLLAVESESRGEVARRHGVRAKNLERGGGVGRTLPLPPAPNFFVPAVPVPSRDSRLPERKRKRLLRRLNYFQHVEF